MGSLPEKEAKELIDSAIALLAILMEVEDDKVVHQLHAENRLHLAIDEAEFAAA